MKQTQVVEQPLYERKVITYELENKATTPSRKSLQETIAALNKTTPDMVVVETIYNAQGTGKFKITALVYSNKDTYMHVVPKHDKKRSGTFIEKGKKKVEAKA